MRSGPRNDPSGPSYEAALAGRIELEIAMYLGPGILVKPCVILQHGLRPVSSMLRHYAILQFSFENFQNNVWPLFPNLTAVRANRSLNLSIRDVRLLKI